MGTTTTTSNTSATSDHQDELPQVLGNDDISNMNGIRRNSHPYPYPSGTNGNEAPPSPSPSPSPPPPPRTSAVVGGYSFYLNVVVINSVMREGYSSSSANSNTDDFTTTTPEV